MLQLLFLTLLQPAAFAMHVIIDPGHGGIDQGTTRKNFKESDVALDVAQRLAAKLRAHGFETTLTRTEDRKIGLLERVRIAQKADGDVLISIHVNSNPDPKAHGAEFYFQNQLAADEEAMYLAHKEDVSEENTEETPATSSFKDVAPPIRTILEDLLRADRIARSSTFCRQLKTHWLGSHRSNARSIHQAPFIVVSEVHVPATLVELGFATNAEDFKALTDPASLNLMAQSLFEGIAAYKELVDKTAPKPLGSPGLTPRTLSSQ